MARARRIGAAIAVLALAGVAISGYLSAVHYAGLPLACNQAGFVNCEAVIGSRYGTIGSSGIPVAAAGIAWFAISLGLGAALVARPVRQLSWVLGAWSGLGMLAVLYLVYIEIVRIGAICAWCTAVDGLVLLTVLLAVYLVWSPPAEDESTELG